MPNQKPRGICRGGDSTGHGTAVPRKFLEGVGYFSQHSNKIPKNSESLTKANEISFKISKTFYIRFQQLEKIQTFHANIQNVRQIYQNFRHFFIKFWQISEIVVKFPKFSANFPRFSSNFPKVSSNFWNQFFRRSPKILRRLWRRKKFASPGCASKIPGASWGRLETSGGNRWGAPTFLVRH